MARVTRYRATRRDDFHSRCLFRLRAFAGKLVFARYRRDISTSARIGPSRATLLGFTRVRERGDDPLTMSPSLSLSLSLSLSIYLSIYLSLASHKAMLEMCEAARTSPRYCALTR